MLLWCLRLWALFMSRRFGSFSKCFELFKEVVFSAEIFWMPIGSPCRLFALRFEVPERLQDGGGLRDQ